MLSVERDLDSNVQWHLKTKLKEKKETVIKNAIAHGVEHINNAGKHVAARQTGPDCRCSRLKCFENLSLAERSRILLQFNGMDTKNEQDGHLAGLITTRSVGRRRSRKLLPSKDVKNMHSSSYTYKIRSSGKEISVCLKAFASLHGITVGRIRHIQKSLLASGASPKDLRGQHKTRPTKTPDALLDLVRVHIKSFKARQSHYSRRDNPNKMYLPESLTVRVMHNMFLDEYQINLPYKAYWGIFKSEFNIKFGLPRSDTCTTCDSLQQKIESSSGERQSFLLEKELHLRKAESFYALKRLYKEKARAGEVTCITFDYMQNLPLPNIKSNAVYYSRQLWYNVFGVHDLANDAATMFVYHEGVAKKGQNDVTSMLMSYLNEREVTNHLVLISDGCSGQNKNYVMVRFLYMLVHCLQLVEKITYLFPVRGHSFLPNDQDFSIIEKKKHLNAEVPEDWDEVIKSARIHPSPFSLRKVDQTDFVNFKTVTDPFFLKNAKPPVQLKKVRMLRITSNKNFLELRDTYAGPWRQSIIRNRTSLPTELTLPRLYDGPILIAPAKMADLQKLSAFLGRAENIGFYDQLVTAATSGQATQDSNQAEIDSDDNSSGCES